MFRSFVCLKKCKFFLTSCSACVLKKTIFFLNVCCVMVFYVFVSFYVLVFVRAILSWCPLTWHIYIVLQHYFFERIFNLYNWAKCLSIRIICHGARKLGHIFFVCSILLLRHLFNLYLNPWQRTLKKKIFNLYCHVVWINFKISKYIV